jgi:hypothetical protein
MIFKASAMPCREGFRLMRVSALARTVRYEWPGVDDCGKSVTYYSPTFAATLQEWERASD